MYSNCPYCMYYCPYCSMAMGTNQFRFGYFPEMTYQGGDLRRQPCNGFMYTVKRGDTLYSIAEHYKISLNDLIRANPQITNPNVLTIGQNICVPGVMPLPTPVECTGRTYVVRSGDTLSTIARRFNVSVSAILAANPTISDPNSIAVGLNLCIPVEVPTPPECTGRTYVIQSGDTLSAIARRFNVSVSAILAANPTISDPDNLIVGVIICIPHACSGQNYAVRRGDTLYGIAQQFGVSYQSLIQANPQITNPNQLFIGQNICIPSVSSPVVYRNMNYGFSFSLPESWRGYRIVASGWEGLDTSGRVVETGPEIIIRHPLWTAERPRQDIPIMIFTLDQWRSLEQDRFHIGAAPIGPRELGRNNRYVMALPARYNFGFPEGYEEVENILQGNPLHTENI